MSLDMTNDADAILRRFQRATDRRAVWEGHWRDVYAYALPQREHVLGGALPGEKKGTRLYDGTAADAVDQLAASLLAELTPPWGRWFDFTLGSDVPEDHRTDLESRMEETAAAVQGHFERSNFAVEIHQCYLDLVTAGTACLMFEEAPVGEPSAFRFTAVPLPQVAFEESSSGALDISYRHSTLTPTKYRARFPDAPMPDLEFDSADLDDVRIDVIEAVVPGPRGYDYTAIRTSGQADGPVVIRTGQFALSPFINFRWSKAPGEIYGRSPVMKALPDIKTANKVVELVLKNASIAVTGIWQADDDGVLNPATIRLEPGTIIPKAVGSAGLTPLRPANDMDLSSIVLEQMRERIRHALLVDLMGQPNTPGMTATEVLQRTSEMSRLLGATYGRLQAELLAPLARRAVSILQRRGEIPRFEIDGRTVSLNHTSPLARQRTQADADMVRRWLDQIAVLGPEAMQLLDPAKTGRYLAKAYGVPADLLRGPDEMVVPPMMDALGDGGADILGPVIDALGLGDQGDIMPATAPTETLNGDG